MSALNEYPENSIAVIGMACRLPNIFNLQEFWNFLINGESSIVDLTHENMLDAGINKAFLADPGYVRRSAIFPGIEEFDAEFFGLTPKEAEVTGPNLRYLLECAYDALSDAGYCASKYTGLIGLYLGVDESTYLYRNILSQPGLEDQIGRKTIRFGNQPAFAATQISYRLNLKGPSVTFCTACSSSLVALHHAISALQNFECDMALVGGAQISPDHLEGYKYVAGGVYSKDGYCRSFDKDASGTVSGNGAGMVLLKRLEDAINDNDSVAAVILGSAINNDGNRKVGYSAPSIVGQASVIADAQELAGVNPNEIDYIEAHGTATPLGDPIEIAALKLAFSRQKSSDHVGSRFCGIGSIKSNVGHLGAGSGIVGIIKTVLSLKNKKIPPTINFNEENLELDLEKSPFFISDRVIPWEKRGAHRVAGVSSFGMGGTNAHVILKDYVSNSNSEVTNSTCRILNLSARNADSLRLMIEDLQIFLGASDNKLADISYTLNQGKDEYDYRIAFSATSKKEAINKINNVLLQKSNEPIVPNLSIVFCFAGQGAQYENMYEGLYKNVATFKNCFDEIKQIANTLGASLHEPRKKQTDIQLWLFASQYSLAKYLISIGIKPAVMIGHSLGEYVAAAIAGVFSLPGVIKIIIGREHLMRTAPAGKMLAVALSAEAVKPLLSDKLEIAAINGPGSVVLSGTEDAIDRCILQLDVNVGWKIINFEKAFHSSLLDGILTQFRELVGMEKLSAPNIPMISNVSGTWLSEHEATSHDYWVNHLRSTVEFFAGLKTINSQNSVFLDLGANNVISSMLDSVNKLNYLTCVRKKEDERDDVEVLFDAIAQLWEFGAPIEWPHMYIGQPQRVSLPAYRYLRKRYWISKNKKNSAFDTNSAEEHNSLPKLYAPYWIASPIASSQKVELNNCLLLISDNFNNIEMLSQMFSQETQRVIAVKQEMDFTEFNADRYGCNFLSKTSIYNLFKAIENSHDKLNVIWVHDNTHVRTDMAISALFNLYQVLGTEASLTNVRILLVGPELTGYESNAINDPKYLSMALVNTVANMEYENIYSSYLGLDSGDLQSIGPLPNHIFNRIKNELISGRQKDSFVSYLAGQRMVKRYCEIEQNQIDPNMLMGTAFKTDGHYLVIGGFSGIGAQIVAHLVCRYNATIMVVSRHANQDYLFKAINSYAEHYQLNINNPKIVSISCDITNEVELGKIWDDYGEPIKNLNGVINLAGDAGGGLISLRSSLDLKNTLAPKVDGTNNLLKKCKTLKLDFFVLFSSLSSIRGGLARADYAAANAYLDGIAEMKHADYQFPIMSLNWCSWSQTGMAVNKKDNKNSVTNAEGIALLERAIISGARRIVISRLDVDNLVLQEKNRKTIEEKVLCHATDVAIKSKARPRSAGEYIPTDNPFEDALARIWKDALGINPIGKKDNYYALGGNSLLLAQLSIQIKKEFGIDMNLQLLLANSVLSDQAEAICRMMLGSANSNEIEEIINSL